MQALKPQKAEICHATVGAISKDNVLPIRIEYTDLGSVLCWNDIFYFIVHPQAAHSQGLDVL